MTIGIRQRLRLRLRMLVGLVALLVSFPGSLCVASSSSKPTEGAEDQSAAKAEVPFQLYNDNLIIVKATIGTMKNVNMILDTGTSPSAISKEMGDRLKLQGDPEPLQTLNGTIQALSVILPRIQIGPLHAESIRVVVQDLSFMERSLGISLGGIAGLDILSTGSFTIDYRRRKIVFGPIAASAKAIRFETQKPFLTVKAKIEGHEVRLLIDSGTWGLLVYRNRLPTAQEQLRFDPIASISTAGGMTHVRWLRAVVSLGSDNLGSRNVAIADVDSDLQNDFDGLLGFAKMGFRKVSFDFENGLFGWAGIPEVGPSGLLAGSPVIIGATLPQERFLTCVAQVSADELRDTPHSDERLTVVILEHQKFLEMREGFHAHKTKLAFSSLQARRIYLSSRMFGDFETLLRCITHELGHFATQSVYEDHAERAADRIRWRTRQVCVSPIQ